MNKKQKISKSEKFDFDKWHELSKKDPKAFEAAREESINEFIGGCEENRQHRLRCLQWKIDRIREKNDTPLSACVAISDMMWDSLERLHRVYYQYEGITSPKAGKKVYAPMPSATVLQLKTPS